MANRWMRAVRQIAEGTALSQSNRTQWHERCLPNESQAGQLRAFSKGRLRSEPVQKSRGRALESRVAAVARRFLALVPRGQSLRPGHQTASSPGTDASERRRRPAGRHRDRDLPCPPGRAHDRLRRERRLYAPRPAARRPTGCRSSLAGFGTLEKRSVGVALGRRRRRGRHDAAWPRSRRRSRWSARRRPSSRRRRSQTNFKYAETVDKLAMNRNLAGHRRAGARPHRQRPEHRPGHDRRRLRLRQRVPAERRGHQRQPVRHRQPALHRGRPAGGHGPHQRRLRRVRPLLRRRHQRHHQERQQHLPGQLAHGHHERRLAGREPGREERDRSRPRPRRTSTRRTCSCTRPPWAGPS